MRETDWLRRLISSFLYCPLPISFYDTEEVEGEKRMGNFGERCLPPATLMENSHGGESRKLGAQKKCVYAALCSVLADGMGNGRIAWEREKQGCAKTSISHMEHRIARVAARP